MLEYKYERMDALSENENGLGIACRDVILKSAAKIMRHNL